MTVPLVTAENTALDLRRRILRDAGATGSEMAELLHYNRNRFVLPDPRALAALPLPDEPGVAAWRRRVHEAELHGAWSALQHWMPQLWYPIEAGMSARVDYRRATSGADVHRGTDSGIVLDEPEAVSLTLRATTAGHVPIIGTSCRADFVRLVQALTRRNEPEVIPASMGACMVGGHLNLQTMHDLHAEWIATWPADRSAAAWRLEQHRRSPDAALYRDRFILVSDGPYSDVTADTIRVEASAWRGMSREIRVEHECTHYVTRRLFGSMANALFDELIADYMGIVAACGRFDAEWCLAFLGVGGGRDSVARGRLQNYRGDPPLSDSAFRILGTLAVTASRNLEAFDRTLPSVRSAADQVAVLYVLCGSSVEELSAPGAADVLSRAFTAFRDSVTTAAEVS